MATRREIRDIETVEEMEECEELQKSVWRFEEREIVPVNELMTMKKNGGIMLGAWDTRREEMIGFLFGMPGITEDEEIIHCSRMLGVIPDHREYNLGFRLKRDQRERALDMDISRITWTYDPLLSVNAYFNLEKLGAEITDFEENLYGSSTSYMNRGWETDRFVVSWNIASEDVERVIEEGERDTPDVTEVIEDDEYTRVNEVERDYNDIPKPVSANLDYRRSNLIVEIPYNVMFIKSEDLELAREWRKHGRAIFKEYMRRDYEISALVTGKVDTRKYRSFYLLTR